MQLIHPVLSNLQWQASVVVNYTMHPLKVIFYMKSNL